MLHNLKDCSRELIQLINILQTKNKLVFLWFFNKKMTLKCKVHQTKKFCLKACTIVTKRNLKF